MGSVFHVSDKQGMTQFVPRRFWHTPDFRSSGNLSEADEPPEGALATYAFYASDWEFSPFYFFPPDVRRIHLQKSKHSDFAAALQLLGLFHVEAERIFVVQSPDREKLLSHQFSIYEFDDASFRRVPTGEYIAEVPVVPFRETVCHNTLASLPERGIHVEFVSDLDDTFRHLQKGGLGFDAQGDFGMW